jgi:hypothetical protein
MRIPIVLPVLLNWVGVLASSATPATLARPHVSYAPKPEYSQFARAHGMKGDGVFILRVQIRTGRVKDVLANRIRLDLDCYIAGENCGEITHPNSCAFFQDPLSSGRTILKELAVPTYGDS